MALRYLLDTNICICINKQRPPAVAKRFARLAAGTVGMSLITFGELRYGAEKSARRKEILAALERLVEVIPVIEPDVAVGAACGALRAQLERTGRTIGNNDLWIAAHALGLGLTLMSDHKGTASTPSATLKRCTPGYMTYSASSFRSCMAMRMDGVTLGASARLNSTPTRCRPLSINRSSSAP